MEVEIRTDLPARIKVGRKRAKDSDPQEVGLSSDIATVESREVQREEEISVNANAPLVEVEVMRVPSNPRLIICRYQILGENRRCKVWVGRNSNFVPGMKFWLLEPNDEPNDPSAQSQPWPYTGPLPRRQGYW
jgi:hypothetical protein